MLNTDSMDEDTIKGNMIALGEGSRAGTHDRAAVYVFRECDREVRDARDNEQKEGRMEHYGGKNDAENSGVGQPEDG